MAHHQRRWRCVLLLIFLAAAGVAPCGAQSAGAKKSSDATPSDSMPSYGLAARLQELPSEFVLVQVWSASCEPCGEEVKELNTVLEQVNAHAPQKLAVLGVPVHSRPREISAFVEHFRPQYPQWTPDAAFLESLAKVPSVPWTLLYAGKIRVKIKEWHAKIDAVELLKELASIAKTEKGIK